MRRRMVWSGWAALALAASSCGARQESPPPFTASGELPAANYEQALADAKANAPVAPEVPADAGDLGEPGSLHPSWRFLRAKYDLDGDGRIASAEYTRSAAGFARLDADADGVVSAADFDASFDGRPRVEGKFQYGIGGPEVGEPAPEFELPATDGRRLALASLRAKKPVALVFGSFT